MLRALLTYMYTRACVEMNYRRQQNEKSWESSQGGPLPPRGHRHVNINSTAAIRRWHTTDWDLRSVEVTRRVQRAWACFGRCKMEIYDRPSVRLRLKVRMLKVEVMETLLYGCVTWNPSKADYARLRKVHHHLAPPMPWLAETKARRSHPVLSQRASEDRLRER